VQLLSPAPLRPVLLVVDDAAGTIVTRLRRDAPDAEVVAVRSAEAGWSALISGRRFSAVVAPAAGGAGDGDRPALVAAGVDPHLVEAAATTGTPVLALGPGAALGALAAGVLPVADPVPRADWPPQLGPPTGDPETLSKLHRTGGFVAAPSLDGGVAGVSPGPDGLEGRLVVVCGPGGTGASTLAAAVARALARRRRGALLADFALRADQAMLNGLEDPAAGLLDLIEAGRYRRLTAIDARRHTVPAAGCRLLPGLRRSGHWTAVTPSLFDQLLAGLLELFDLIVADVTGEFEGEAETGSIDVEERNHMARRSALAADVVVVVGGIGNGGHRLARVVDELLDLGVDPARILPVVRCLAYGSNIESTIRSPVCGLPAPPVTVAFAGEEGGGHFPSIAVGDLVAAVSWFLADVVARDRRPPLVRVTPGSLGCVAP
jgi:hypothetical protein